MSANIASILLAHPTPIKKAKGVQKPRNPPLKVSSPSKSKSKLKSDAVQLTHPSDFRASSTSEVTKTLPLPSSSSTSSEGKKKERGRKNQPRTDTGAGATRKNTLPATCASSKYVYVCEICRECYDQQFSFYGHLQTHYGKVAEKRSPPKSKETQKAPRLCKSNSGDVAESPCVTATTKTDSCDGGGNSLTRRNKIFSSYETTPFGVENDRGDETSVFQPSQQSAQNNLEETIPPPPLPFLPTSPSLISCSNCPKKFKTTKNFLSHVSVCGRKTPLQSTNNTGLTRSLEEEFHNIMKEARASSSGKKVPTKKDAKENLREATTEPVDDCDDDDIFSVPDEDPLYQNYDGGDEVEDEEEMQFLYLQSNICPCCDEPFETKLVLDNHMHQHHPHVFAIQVEAAANTKVKPTTVTSAPDSGKQAKPVIDANGKVTNGHLKCQYCHRAFHHRNSLVYHMRGHTGERPYKCETCGKRFFATSALKVHTRMHLGVKPYKCDECDKCFRQWGDLSYHKASIHSSERAFQCEFCGKDFARKYSLTIHRRIHTGERNYKCDICNKGFRAASYLQNHRRVHTGEKPHPCSICGKPFRVRSDMKRHEESHGRAVKKLLSAVGGSITTVTTVPVTTAETITNVIVPVVSAVDTGDKQMESIPIIASVEVDANGSILGTTTNTGEQIGAVFNTKEEAYISVPIISQQDSSLVGPGTMITSSVNAILVDQTSANSLQSTLQSSGVVHHESMTLYQDNGGQNLELLSSDGAPGSSTVVLLPYIQT